MAQITNRVGSGSSPNLPHDVALIQAMLKVIRNRAGQPYFLEVYNGKCLASTIAAIKAFQAANQTAASPVQTQPARPGTMGLPPLRSPNSAFGPPPMGIPSLRLPSAGVALVPAPAATSLRAPVLALQDELGTIRPFGPTMSKLNEMLPVPFKAIRSAPGAHLVYWAGTKADAVRSAAAVRSHTELQPALTSGLSSLVDQMFDKYEIVLDCLENSAPLRGYQKQYELKRDTPGVTDAGPGESNHNYGGAMDIAYFELQWMHPHGHAVFEEGIGLEKLDKVNDGWVKEMFRLRNALAAPLGLFPTTKKNDPEHLQIFEDAHVTMANSLAKLLCNTGARMQWEAISHHPNLYKCDLGFGGTLHKVGDAMQIWTKHGPMEKAWIAQGKHVPVTAVSDADVAAMRQALWSAFAAAEAARGQWTPEP